jgi:NAD(P)H-dependent flavin oxidoreductase YrpB (nitropropane dioxygenase family)
MRSTPLLGIEHPIISAPMGFAADGRLAAAVHVDGRLRLDLAAVAAPVKSERGESKRRRHVRRSATGFVHWILQHQVHRQA